MIACRDDRVQLKVTIRVTKCWCCRERYVSPKHLPFETYDYVMITFIKAFLRMSIEV